MNEKRCSAYVLIFFTLLHRYKKTIAVNSAVAVDDLKLMDR